MYFTIGSIVGYLLALGGLAILIFKWNEFAEAMDLKARMVKRNYYGNPSGPWKAWMIMRGLVYVNPDHHQYRDEAWEPSRVLSTGERSANAFLLAMFFLLILIAVKFLSLIAWPLVIILGFIMWGMIKGKFDSKTEV